MDSRLFVSCFKCNFNNLVTTEKGTIICKKCSTSNEFFTKENTTIVPNVIGTFISKNENLKIDEVYVAMSISPIYNDKDFFFYFSSQIEQKNNVPDIVVWHKKYPEIQTGIEIKKAYPGINNKIFDKFISIEKYEENIRRTILEELKNIDREKNEMLIVQVFDYEESDHDSLYSLSDKLTNEFDGFDKDIQIIVIFVYGQINSKNGNRIKKVFEKLKNNEIVREST